MDDQHPTNHEPAALCAADREGGLAHSGASPVAATTCGDSGKIQGIREQLCALAHLIYMRPLAPVRSRRGFEPPRHREHGELMMVGLASLYCGGARRVCCANDNCHQHPPKRAVLVTVTGRRYIRMNRKSFEAQELRVERRLRGAPTVTTEAPGAVTGRRRANWWEGNGL